MDLARFELSLVLQVLQRTPAAFGKMGASRIATIRAGLEDTCHLGFRNLSAVPQTGSLHLLTGKRALDKYYLAVEAPNTATVMGEVGNLYLSRLPGGGPHSSLYPTP